MPDKKPVTDKIINRQEISSVMCDVKAGIVKVEVSYFRERAMPADAQNPNPYTAIDNRTGGSIIIPLEDLQPHFDNFINQIDLLV